MWFLWIVIQNLCAIYALPDIKFPNLYCLFILIVNCNLISLFCYVVYTQKAYFMSLFNIIFIQCMNTVKKKSNSSDVLDILYIKVASTKLYPFILIQIYM